jgi:hypothetical protein
VTDGSKKKRSPRQVFESLEQSARELELAEKIDQMSDDELDRDLRAEGGDPDAIADRAQALVDELAAADERPPMRLAAGLPRRQALLAILAEEARDPRKKALLDRELGGKKLADATDEELARAVTRVRGA